LVHRSAADTRLRFVMQFLSPLGLHHLWAVFDQDTERYVDAADLRIVTSRFQHADIIKMLALKRQL
jgi:hypothetical protein